MHFSKSGVANFLTIFNANKHSIRHFNGCMHLELLRDLSLPETYTTISHWQSEDHLNAYRKSTLFETVWKDVKNHFAAHPEAFSLESIIEL